MKEVISDALLDGLKVFPFLFLIYVIMEIIESAKSKVKIEKTLSGAAAPAAAGVLGAIPECGFSVMCAKLYDKGLIKLGTLIAAFISISDEGLIVLISSGAAAKDIFDREREEYQAGKLACGPGNGHAAHHHSQGERKS